MFGFYKVCAAIPKIKIADIKHNIDQIIQLSKESNEEKVALTVFPEMSVTGYTCGDLFLQSKMLESVKEGISYLCLKTASLKTIIIIGAPVRVQSRLYDCAVVLQAGKILGVVPKSYLPNYKEFYEKRWFYSGKNIRNENIEYLNSYVPFGIDLLFEYDQFFSFGVEICEDLWNVIPPSTYQALAGAAILVNISASNDLVGKSEYRRRLITGQSARCLAAYVYSSSGIGESTTDLVYGGHAVIAENGVTMTESNRFSLNETKILFDIDCQKLMMLRLRETTHADNDVPPFRRIKISEINTIKKLNRTFSKTPFIPENTETIKRHCNEIFKIQSFGLYNRLKHINIKKTIIGISGGLDSTLALMVIAKTYKLAGIPNKNIITVIMPGFGTTNRTHENATLLCETLGTEILEIDIKNACEQHFKDIDFNPKNLGITYENAQARQRMMILMDLANKNNAIVIGTGDLSEIALGWSTYNADHMSMYNVNCSVPKTLVKTLLKFIINNEENQNIKTIINNILETPISPELLPKSKDGKLLQKTEQEIGPYEIHDFILYHFIRYGASPEKILFLANETFNNNKKEIKNFIKIFFKRFFAQQYKRNCMPDGPKIGLIALSPRGDWRMPSDAKVSSWLLKD